MKKLAILPVLLLSITLTAALSQQGAGLALWDENPGRSENLEETWVDAQEANNIVYFLYASPPKIARYDLVTQNWLDPITLAESPNVFTVDPDGIYIGLGTSVKRYNLDGTGEMNLFTVNSDVASIHAAGDYLFINHTQDIVPEFTSINKYTGNWIDTKDYKHVIGVSIAPAVSKLFGRQTHSTADDIIQMEFNSDGTLGPHSQYISHLPDATKTYLNPEEINVIDNAGTVFNTSVLEYHTSLAGAFDDLTFLGDLPIVLRDGVLIAHTKSYLETGRYAPANSPDRIFNYDEHLYSFYEGSEEIGVEIIPMSTFTPLAPGDPISPVGLSFMPDQIILGNSEIVFLMSSEHFSIFRWNVATRSYMDTIPLIDAPNHMAYSPVTNHMYLAYPSGKITQIKLDESMMETPIANVPADSYIISTAGEFLFVSSALDEMHETYNSEGNLFSRIYDRWYSKQYEWSETNGKMYYLSRQNDLYWEDIDTNGVIGEQQKWPYHSVTSGVYLPIRVNPDGSVVILGSGRIYDGISLEQVSALPERIRDATWHNQYLYTTSTIPGWTHLQKWDSDYSEQSKIGILGGSLRVFSVREGLLVINQLSGKPEFTLWDENLNEIYQPIKQVMSLPVLNSCRALYFEDFSDPSSGWPTGDNGNIMVKYSSGEYQMLVRKVFSSVGVRPDFVILDNSPYTLTVDVTNNFGIPGSYGLVFDLSWDWFYFNTFEITQDGYYYFYRVTNSDDWEILAEGWTPHINTGAAKNTLKVARNGYDFHLYINSEHILTITQDSYSGTRHVGLFASTFGDGNLDLTFDNFAVYPLTCIDHLSNVENITTGYPAYMSIESSTEKMRIMPSYK